jgi:phosphohistidine phosphatase
MSAALLLDLVRHGEALPSGEGGDAARRLSPAGRATITRLAERLRREGWKPTALWASPLARAQETAAILVAASPGLPIGTLEALIPDGEPDVLAEELRRRATAGHVVLVGHQPLMGRLSAWLTGGRESAFSAGSLVRVEIAATLHRGCASVVLEIPPLSS